MSSCMVLSKDILTVFLGAMETVCLHLDGRCRICEGPGTAYKR